MDLKTTILLFALVCALAVVFVLWAKWEEQKLKTREERECYEAMLRLHNMTAEAAQEKDAEIESLGYLLQAEKRTSERMLEARCKLEVGYERVSKRNSDLQDHLSALLCPTNNHVWKDGCCVKCGRVQDD